MTVNFLPFALIDPAAPVTGTSGDEVAGELIFPDVGYFDDQYVHGYGKVANVEAGLVFLDDRAGLIHWKVYGGIWVRPLGAKTGSGGQQDAPGRPVTLVCPF